MLLLLLLPTVPPAGFHNASLYPALRPAVPPLVALLRDEEDRTRANAAGALGNLVRNSGMLCGDIREAGALEVRACVRGATVGAAGQWGRGGTGAAAASGSAGGPGGSDVGSRGAAFPASA